MLERLRILDRDDYSEDNLGLIDLITEVREIVGPELMDEARVRTQITRYFALQNLDARGLSEDQMWEMLGELQAQNLWHDDKSRFLYSVRMHKNYIISLKPDTSGTDDDFPEPVFFD